VNFDDLAERVAAGLDAKYEGYDVGAARARLEDRVLRDEMASWGGSGAARAAHPAGTAPTPRTDPAPGTTPTSAEDWRVHASCRDEEPDQLFLRGAEQRKAKVVCLGCPVRTECLAEALDLRIEFGVWGGMTERERRALLRRRPDVTSWYDLLNTARQEHVEGVAAAGERAEKAEG
jgi:WhiB family redox-sensing transcriptional regulator